MHSESKISILLAVYNGEDWISEAIKSVIGQTNGNWELIIVDNGSLDGTWQIAMTFAKNDDRIRAYRLSEKGKNRAYNLAYSHSRGNYVAFFAADDLLTHDCIEKRLLVIDSLGEKSGLTFVTSVMKTISNIDKYDGLQMPKDSRSPNFSGGSLMFDRKLAELVFPIPEELPNEDTWTQLHLRSFGHHVHIPEVLYLYRIHENNSFGYGESFDIKREAFLKRMRAYKIFVEKHASVRPGNLFIEKNIIPFKEGLDLLEEEEFLGIIISRNLGLKMKLILLYYSSPILFSMRKMLFRFLSGRIGQI